MSLHELGCTEYRFDDLADPRYRSKHGDFITNLTFDPRGFPMYNENIAGISACFTFSKQQKLE